MLAPVAMFVYNRADNTQKTLEHLMANTLARETDVYVFADGGKDEASWKKVSEVRAYLHHVREEVAANHSLRSLTLIERPENYYLERNITEGIAQVFEEHDRIIVLEDDICTSPYYLEYMNRAFDLYADCPKVMHVSGFTNLDLKGEHASAVTTGQDCYFTPHMSGWGWGTWRDRWQKHFRHYTSADEALHGFTQADVDAMQYGGVFPCLKSVHRNPIPWDICWEIAIHRAGGLCLTPAHTMVRNIGLQNGTHFRAFSILQHYNYDREPWQERLDVPEVADPQKDPRIEALFAEAITDWGIRYTWLGTIVRYFYKKITGSK